MRCASRSSRGECLRDDGESSVGVGRPWACARRASRSLTRSCSAVTWASVSYRFLRRSGPARAEEKRQLAAQVAERGRRTALPLAVEPFALAPLTHVVGTRCRAGQAPVLGPLALAARSRGARTVCGEGRGRGQLESTRGASESRGVLVARSSMALGHLDGCRAGECRENEPGRCRP